MNIDLNSFLKINGEKLISDRIVFLLGAGASIDAGIPPLGKITDDLEIYLDWYSRANKIPELKELYIYFKNECYTSKYNLSNYPTIENILALINDCLALRSERKIYTIIGVWDKELMEITKGDFDKIRKLKSVIDWFFLNILTWKRFDNEEEEKKLKGEEQRIITEEKEIGNEEKRRRNKERMDEEEKKGTFIDHPYNLQYLYFIFYLQVQLTGNLKIFSLNHDMVIEKAFAKMVAEGLLDNKKTRLEVGHKTIEANPKKIFDFYTNEKTGPEPNTCQLFKMHGSVDWRKDKETGCINIEPFDSEQNEFLDNNIDGSGLIFGVNQKFKSEEPYSSLYSKFKSTLIDKNLKVRFLIIVGYSFNDEHINDAIASALEQNKDLHIIITDPNLCETCYYSYPVIAAGSQNKFVENIIKSSEYESYLNMSFMLHSLYYSRNFEEDAIFLAYCSRPKMGDNPLLLTLAGKNEEQKEMSITLLNSILSYDDFNNPNKITSYEVIKNSFDPDFAKKTKSIEKIETRNKNLYTLLNPALGGEKGLDYDQILSLIGEIKVFLYHQENHLDQKGRDDTNNKKQHLYSKYIVREILDEIRTIEHFIKHFIPIHLCLLFAHIEVLEELRKDVIVLEPSEKESRELNIKITIYEMFLKFHYLTDTLIVKIAEIDNDKKERETFEELLSLKYVTEYLNILEHKISDIDDPESPQKKFTILKDKIGDLNYNLYRIRNGVLQTSLLKDKDYEFIKDITKENISKKPTFEEYFLTVDEAKKSELLKLDTFLKSVLHPIAPAESKMKLSVKLYSKAIIKSMISRILHSSRIQKDYIKLLTQLKDNNNPSRENSKRRPTPPPLFNGKAFINADLINEDFFWGIMKKEEFKEMRIKLDINLNWYVERYGRIMTEFIDNLFVLRFDDPQRDYTNNLLVYLKLLNRNEQKCDLYRHISKKGYKGFIRNEKLKFGEGRIGNLLAKFLMEDRISIKHFPAEIFFSKDLRLTNLFKFYHSHFYLDAHITNFGNTEKLITDFYEDLYKEGIDSRDNADKDE